MNASEDQTSVENSSVDDMPESGIHVKRDGIFKIAGAIALIAYNVFFLGWPTEWWEYITSMVLLVLVVMLTVQGIRQLTRAGAEARTV
ncbi:hypothetical protein D6T64_20530 [Cryobacterium melibiosiphilum]|uniref:Uncharacterized protein n=1 Tax=Cryobacterium melibiosiphilum TaxID=995039 RepID=A0A3A5MB94_9MICO|nr:hypothetical protein [Cryobacterium melibiosiphilum]RJT84559.1 hypothetical protein D6T64_20530 [Cryobacterium melibiosiphilum]